MAREPIGPPRSPAPCMTSFVFRVRNVPAALYKAMGGFATNGVNMTKLESYMVDGALHGDPVLRRGRRPPGRPRRCALALEELEFFSREVRILGVYPAAPLPPGAPRGGVIASVDADGAVPSFHGCPAPL